MLYLDLFNHDYVDRSPVGGIRTPHDLPYLKRLYHFNKDAIENYYLTRTFSVKNTHILSRFLEHLSPHFGYDSYRYLDYAENNIRYLAKHFRFTSDMEKGLVHPPHFFGNDGEEVIFVEYSPFNVHEFERHWKTAPCIRILKHPRNDLKLLLPLGRDDGSRGGLSVISLDPLKLAIKYREFLREQQRISLMGGSPLGKNQFVMRYVLPGMMESVIDHVFLNRLMDAFYGREEVVPEFKHRFKLYEPTTQVDRYVQQTLETIRHKDTDFITLLHNIQLIFEIDASALLCLPDMSGTRQSKWALIASRLEYMCFLCDVAKSTKHDHHILNDWKRLIKRLERDMDIRELFSYETGQQLYSYMEKIKNA